MCFLLGSELDYSWPVVMAKQECKTRIVQSLETIVENATNEVVDQRKCSSN